MSSVRALIKHPARLFRAVGFRMQLIILLVGVLGMTLSLFSTVLYTNFIRVHEFEFDAALYNYAVNVARNLDVNMFGEVVVSDDVFRETEKIFPFSIERTLFQLITADGRFIAKSRELHEERIPIRIEDLETVRINRVMFSSAEIRYQKVKHDYRVAQLFIDRPGSNDFILQVAAPMILLQREKKALVLFFLLSIPTAVIIAGVLSYSLSKRALSPINDIIRKAREISASNLSDRLPVPRVEDELHEMATTLNELLHRLQSAFISQEAFVSDASHQLKTPLAILKGELDVMRRKTELNPNETQEFLESASDEVRYLTGMVERLLILARVESGGAGVQMKSVRLDELVIDVVSRLQKNHWITKKGLKLQFNFKG
ncbi:MAG: HAMP domain-containing protein, partial [Proteobacteria bacterium]